MRYASAWLIMLMQASLACGSHPNGPANGDAGSGGAQGGSGGSGGAAAAGNSGAGGTAVDDANDCPCILAPLSWGPIGNTLPAVDRSNILGCRTFSYHRFTFGDAGGRRVLCEQELVACAGALSPRDVDRARFHPDVQAALPRGIAVYGDAFPDGSFFQVELGGPVLDVGLPCASPGCTPIPRGVQEFADLLRALTRHEFGRAPCIHAPPPI
jgi:hypothetical protein